MDSRMSKKKVNARRKSNRNIFSNKKKRSTSPLSRFSKRVYPNGIIYASFLGSVAQLVYQTKFWLSENFDRQRALDSHLSDMHGLVAQLVERCIHIANVRGSSPLESTVLEKKDRREWRYSNFSRFFFSSKTIRYLLKNSVRPKRLNDTRN